ncbi:MAG: hypothetical protein ACR2MB_04530, partial [Acidimicrobiales bacterium]
MAGTGLVAVVVLVAWGCVAVVGHGGHTSTAGRSPTGSAPGTPTPTGSTKGGSTKGGSAPTSGRAPKRARAFDGWVDPKSSGHPWSSTVTGQLTFRGNPTRSYYGLGPVPKHPKIQWKQPASGGWCGSSPVGNTPHSWCGSGWTGEPAVWAEGKKTWVSLGAYDKNVHFLDAASGEQILSDYAIGDIVKGSVTRDPDGYPLLYTGSRADFHILALDRND